MLPLTSRNSVTARNAVLSEVDTAQDVLGTEGLVQIFYRDCGRLFLVREIFPGGCVLSPGLVCDLLDGIHG